MDIYIDTNIFYDHWAMESQYFKILFNYVNNTCEQILIHDTVIKEVTNKHRSKHNELISHLKKVAKAEKQLTGHTTINPENFAINPYDFVATLRQHTELFEIIGYEDISIEEIVTKAVEKKRPFRENEKGFRDAIIWSGITSYLRKNTKGNKPICFITNNLDDFFTKEGDDYKLHSDLIEDISSIKTSRKVIPYTSLYSFISENVDTATHALNHDEIESIYGNDIVEYATEAISILSNEELEQSGALDEIPNNIKPFITIHSIDILEDIEDPEVLEGYKLNDNEIYVRFYFNLRRVLINFSIPKQVYFASQDETSQLGFNITADENKTIFTRLFRPDIIAGLTYNLQQEVITNITIENLTLS